MNKLIYIITLLSLVGCSSLKNSNKISYKDLEAKNDSLNTLIRDLQVQNKIK